VLPKSSSTTDWTGHWRRSGNLEGIAKRPRPVGAEKERTMRNPSRHFIRLMIIAAGLLAIGASNTKCDSDAVKPLLMSLREIHAALDDVEEAVCAHYELSGHGDVAPDFCPDLDPCDEPMDVGPCDAAIPRWYFDADAGECLRFSWGGCEANGNNFLTKARCEATCDPCEADCGPGQVCVRDGDCSGEVCDYCADTCRGVECAEGEHCELVEVHCFTTPCPPVAQCVPDEDPTDPCNDRVCDPGYHCEVVGLPFLCALGMPCLPPVACIPDVDPCDDHACMDDEVCVHETARSCPSDASSCDPYGPPECAPAEPCGGECPAGSFCIVRLEITPFADEHVVQEGYCSPRTRTIVP